ncbi:MAG: DUF2189 domain-containing protein [Rhodomicrobium sp.]
MSAETGNLTGVSRSSSVNALTEEAPAIRRVAFDAPWHWLAAGWNDLWSAPQISLVYGAAFSVAAYLLTLGLMNAGTLPLILPLAGMFLLVGPLLAIGLYEISRKRESGEAANFAGIAHAAWAARRRLALFGMLLLIINLTWVLVALLLFMLFFGAADIPPMDAFIPVLLFAPHGVGLLVTGTLAGAVLAAITYAVSAISVPMILDRKIDAISAAAVSVQAVRLNLPAMALWAALIAGLSALGLVTLFVGLAIAFPLIGHATWHAYRDLTH